MAGTNYSSWAAFSASRAPRAAMEAGASDMGRSSYASNAKRAWRAEQERMNELRALSAALTFEREQGLGGYADYLQGLGGESEQSLSNFYRGAIAGTDVPIDPETQALMVATAGAPLINEAGMMQSNVATRFGNRGVSPGSAITDSAIRGVRTAAGGALGSARANALAQGAMANYGARAGAAGGLGSHLAQSRGAHLAGVEGMANFRANTPLAGAQGARTQTPIMPFQYTPSQRKVI